MEKNYYSKLSGFSLKVRSTFLRLLTMSLFVGFSTNVVALSIHVDSFICKGSHQLTSITSKNEMVIQTCFTIKSQHSTLNNILRAKNLAVNTKPFLNSNYNSICHVIATPYIKGVVIDKCALKGKEGITNVVDTALIKYTK